MNAYTLAFERYLDFSGRTSRKNFWNYVLVNLIFAVIAFFLDNLLNINFIQGQLSYGPIYLIYGLVSIIPSMAISVRRLHDINKSGTNLLLSFIPFIGGIWLLVLYVKEGDKGVNRYGPNVEDMDAKEIKMAIENTFVQSGEAGESISTSIVADNDRMIVAIVLFMFAAQIFFSIINHIISEVYKETWYIIVSAFISICFGLIPLALSKVIKEKNKRTLVLVIGLIYLLYDIYQQIERIIL